MNFNRLLLLFILSFFLPSCQMVQGEESAFQAKPNWDYGANVAPQALLDQFRQENIDQEWIGDPKRFRVLKIQALGQKTLYFVYPFIDCPENGCVTLQLRQLYQPLCNASGGCGYFVYAEENGKYRQVFHEVVWKQVDEGKFVQVSTIPFQGLPSCFKLGGFDGDRRESIKKINGVIVSQYCYNGREYVFDNYQTVQD